eukprot:gene8366-biopygen18117
MTVRFCCTVLPPYVVANRDPHVNLVDTLSTIASKASSFTPMPLAPRHIAPNNGYDEVLRLQCQKGSTARPLPGINGRRLTLPTWPLWGSGGMGRRRLPCRAGPSLLTGNCWRGSFSKPAAQIAREAVLVGDPQGAHMACGAVTPQGGHRRGRGPRQPRNRPPVFLAPTVAARLLGRANGRGGTGPVRLDIPPLGGLGGLKVPMAVIAPKRPHMHYAPWGALGGTWVRGTAQRPKSAKKRPLTPPICLGLGPQQYGPGPVARARWGVWGERPCGPAPKKATPGPFICMGLGPHPRGRVNAKNGPAPIRLEATPRPGSICLGLGPQLLRPRPVARARRGARNRATAYPTPGGDENPPYMCGVGAPPMRPRTPTPGGDALNGPSYVWGWAPSYTAPLLRPRTPPAREPPQRRIMRPRTRPSNPLWVSYTAPKHA